MHDIRFIRAEPAAFDAAMAKRGSPPAAERLLALDADLRAVQTELQAGLARRNEASKAIGQAKAAKDDVRAAELMAEVGALKSRLPELEGRERIQCETQALCDQLASLSPGEDAFGLGLSYPASEGGPLLLHSLRSLP